MGVGPHPSGRGGRRRLDGRRTEPNASGTGVGRSRPPGTAPTVAAVSSPRNGSRPFEISAGAAIKLGFFAALGATVFSLALTVVAGAIGLLLALLFGTSLLGLLDR